MRAALLALVLLGCGPDLDALRGQGVHVDLPGDAGAPAPAPDAGPPSAPGDAGFAQVVEPITPEPDCGLPGLECCPGSLACEVGACLRGRCSAASGAVGEAVGCNDPCGVRNPFTAGCSCAMGFARSDVGAVLGACADGSPTTLSLGFCDGGYGSAFVSVAAACGGCVTPHPRTGTCGCPAGQLALRVQTGRPTAACGDAPAELGLCLDPGGRGAYQRDPFAGCVAPNPRTGGCACPAGSVEQRLPLTRPEGAVRVDAPVTLCLDP